MANFHKLDNLMVNFLHAFNNIAVGCSCKRKARIGSTNLRKKESIENMSQSFIAAVKENIKEDLANIKTGESSTYTKSLVEFRKLPKDFRRRAMTKYMQLRGEAPNPLDPEHLQELTKIGKVFRDAFNR